MTTNGFYSTVASPYAIQAATSYIVFNQVPAVLGYNSGVLDPSTGVATINQDGVYEVAGAVTFEWNGPVSNRLATIRLEVNGALTTVQSSQNYSSNDDSTLHFSAPMYLRAGQQLRVKLILPSLDLNNQFVKQLGTYFAIAKLA